MKLHEYLEESGENEQHTSGVVSAETNWMFVAPLKLSTGHLWIGDPQFSWAEANEGEGCVVKLPIGAYRVEAKGVAIDGSRYVSRVRVVPDGCQSLIVGDPIGEAETDSAQIGLADQQALKASFDAACGDDVDAALNLLEENIEATVGVFEPEFGGDGRLIYLPSGLGDGGGPVLQLLADGECVGIEHAFIDPAEPF